MKAISIIQLIIIGLLGPRGAGCQPDGSISMIELSKGSRGYQEEVRITPDSINIFTQNRIEGGAPRRRAASLPDGAWDDLAKTVGRIDLAELPGLPSPSMQRAADAAMHATITVTTTDGKSYAHSYDDEYPHALLKPLLDKIREITGPPDKP